MENCGVVSICKFANTDRNPDRTSAFLASSESDSNGSVVVWVACIVDPSGKFTTLLESPVMGKFSSGQTKLEVAPESTTMVDAFHWKVCAYSCVGFSMPLLWIGDRAARLYR